MGRRVGAALVAAACALGEPEPPTPALAPPTLYAGHAGEVRARGLPPGATARVVAAQRPFERCAAGACPPADGVTRAWEVVADARGEAVALVSMPRTGRTVWWRLLVEGGVRTEPVASELLLEAPPVPTVTDGDGDGLPDWQEAALGADPARADTDGDGVRDGDDPRPTQADPPPPPAVDLPVGKGGLAGLAFEPGGTRAVWQESRGEALWVARVDVATGALDPPDGRGERVDEGLARRAASGEGPVWVEAGDGPRVVYARANDGEPALWAARDGEAGWSSAPLGVLGAAPRPGGVGRVLYELGGQGLRRLGWVGVDGGGRGAAPTGLRHGVAVPGGEQVLLVSSDTPRQLVALHVRTHALEAWTTDPGDKAEPRAWAAPELGGETLIAAVVSPLHGRPTELRVYRRGVQGWALHHVVTGPPGLPHVLSPEVFTWGGRSYAAFVASQGSAELDGVRGEVWLASLDPDAPFVRRISDAAPAVREAPRAFVGGPRPWVYYGVAGPGGRAQLRRCELGL